MSYKVSLNTHSPTIRVATVNCSANNVHPPAFWSSNHSAGRWPVYARIIQRMKTRQLTPTINGTKIAVTASAKRSMLAFFDMASRTPEAILSMTVSPLRVSAMTIAAEGPVLYVPANTVSPTRLPTGRDSPVREASSKDVAGLPSASRQSTGGDMPTGTSKRSPTSTKSLSTSSVGLSSS